MQIKFFLQFLFKTVIFCAFTGWMNLALAQTLDDALRAGLINSSELKAARQTWSAARESIGASTSTSDLSASFSSTGSYSRTDTKSGAGYKGSDTLSNSITLSKNIYDGGQTRENTILAKINLKTAGADYRNAEQSVILATAKSYLSVLKASREAELHSSNLERLGRHVNAATIRVEAGADTPTSLSDARARFSRAESDTILAKTRLVNAEDMFSSLADMAVGKTARSNDQPLNINILPKSVVDSEQIAVENHPTIVTAIGKEKAAAQAFKTLKASVNPSVALSLSATSTARTSNVLKASLTFSSQLFASSASTASARRIASLHSQSKFNLKEALRSVKLSARSAFRDWETNIASLNAVKSELEASRLVAQGISNEAKYGQKTTLDLLDAEKDVKDVELRLVSAEHDQILAGFALQAAVGKLTADQLGLTGVIKTLKETPIPKSPIGTIFPFILKDID